jgi:predicted HicB family RNase H-like nuclease
VCVRALRESEHDEVKRYMADKRLELRISKKELLEWKLTALAANMSLSAWIRFTLNAKAKSC